MIEIADGKIDIMAGSGINALNVKEFSKIGVQAVHFTAKRDLKELLPIDMAQNMPLTIKKLMLSLRPFKVNNATHLTS
jgi:copper homeostasis protein CutC